MVSLSKLAKNVWLKLVCIYNWIVGTNTGKWILGFIATSILGVITLYINDYSFNKPKEREKKKIEFDAQIEEFRLLDSAGTTPQDKHSSHKKAIEKFAGLNIPIKEYPEEYAYWNLHMANCKYNFIDTETDYLEVIRFYDEALKVLTEKKHPIDFYAAMVNKGNTYNRLSAVRSYPTQQVHVSRFAVEV